MNLNHTRTKSFTTLLAVVKTKLVVDLVITTTLLVVKPVQLAVLKPAHAT
jgi:hypothetical protein